MKQEDHAPVEHQMDKHPETKIKSQQITEILVTSNLVLQILTHLSHST